MTYVVYCAWIASLVLVVGELDRLIARRILDRFRLVTPEAHGLVPAVISTFLPGLGQFVNGQPLKALFLLFWPFMVVFGNPVPRPWQMLALKSGWILLPWWGVAVLDALIVGLYTHWKRQQDRAAARAHTGGFYDYLNRRSAPPTE